MPPERGLFESRRVSVSVSERRNAGFYAPVSASKISVPDSESETGSMTTAWGVTVRSPGSSPSSFPESRLSSFEKTPFLRGFCF
jgi:hypothetical protein